MICWAAWTAAAETALHINEVVLEFLILQLKLLKLLCLVSKYGP